MKMDWLHLVSVVVFLAQMGFILGFYVPLISNKEKHQTSADGDAFISDFLFHDASYLAGMTVFVCLQLLMCALLVWRWKRLKRQGSHTFETWACACCAYSVDHFLLYAEIGLLVFTLVGWVVLCSDYSGSERRSDTHVTGVGVFITGSFIYYSLMVVYVFSRDHPVHRGVVAVFCVIVLMFLASCVTGIIFISMALSVLHDAWIYEHVSYALFCVCHILLFGVDWWLDFGGGAPAYANLGNSEFDPPPSSDLFERVRIRLYDQPLYPHSSQSLAASRLLCL
jgi:hypothetical protein